MSNIFSKVQNALDESRILVLGTQVLVGLQFRSALEHGFESLPFHTQILKLIGLSLLLLALALFMSPAAYHRIVHFGNDNNDMHDYVTSIMCLGLFPFAIALGLDMFLVGEKLFNATKGIVMAGATSLVALGFWYGFVPLKKRKMKKPHEEHQHNTPLETRVKQVLTETRVVLPGVQTLLGFQFIAVLMQGFEKLPETSKMIHVISLSCVALSMILLMTPAAYHRIVERGEDSESFHRLASIMLLAAMVPLALGLAGDFYLVLEKTLQTTGGALIGATLMLLLFFGLWFGYTSYKARQIRSAAV